jgi:hypothetical protein
MQGSIYWKIPPHPPPGGGGNKYGLMGKKYHENNARARADKKGEKERKDKGKEKISDKMTEQEQGFIKNAGNRGHNIIFFPYYFNYRAKKRTKIRLGENILYFFPLCLYFFPIRPCNNCSTFRDGVIGGKYGKSEIKSYNV